MMLWKELVEKENCDSCPLLKNEICPGGIRCYGREPIEPPCCSFSDDTDLDEWVSDYFNSMRRCKEAEDKRIREERKKKERAQKAADTRRAMRWYCWDEIKTLKQAQNALKKQQEIVKVNPKISAEVHRLEAEVNVAKEAYNAKREKFYVIWKKGIGE